MCRHKTVCPSISCLPMSSSSSLSLHSAVLLLQPAGRIPTSTLLRDHGMEVKCTSSKNPRVVRLPDELVAEILARLPYRSLCQFKCVSRSWRDICSESAVLRRCPQTLSGFFFRTMPLGRSRFVRHFVNESGSGPPMVDPSLPFLPPGYSDAVILDCCNGLLLCKRRDIHCQPQVTHSYFVCNPATGKWTVLPDSEVAAKKHCLGIFRLGFDPAVSCHFRVFVFDSDPRPPMTWDHTTTGVEIFSSETGAWSYKKSEWGDRTVIGLDSVFFNGTLHLTSPGFLSLLTVDMDGRAWGKIRTPHDFSFIGVSQGRLHGVQIMNCRSDDECIRIWVLEVYARQRRWTLKHVVSAMQMFGAARPRSFGDSYSFLVHAVHPEKGLIFLTAGRLRSLMSYDMDKKEVRFIWTLGEDNLSVHPYVPCFSEWPLNGN